MTTVVVVDSTRLGSTLLVSRAQSLEQAGRIQLPQLISNCINVYTNKVWKTNSGVL
jgi:hypothetical protein